MRTIGVLIALAGALALQTTLTGLTIAGATAVNLVLVAVIYVALAFGPVAGLLAGSAGGLVQDALAGLREKDRDILQLAYWDELSIADIAGVLHCSESAAKVRLHRARAAFRKQMPVSADTMTQKMGA